MLFRIHCWPWLCTLETHRISLSFPCEAFQGSKAVILSSESSSEQTCWASVLLPAPTMQGSFPIPLSKLLWSHASSSTLHPTPCIVHGLYPYPHPSVSPVSPGRVQLTFVLCWLTAPYSSVLFVSEVWERPKCPDNAHGYVGYNSGTEPMVAIRFCRTSKAVRAELFLRNGSSDPSSAALTSFSSKWEAHVCCGGWELLCMSLDVFLFLASIYPSTFLLRAL